VDGTRLGGKIQVSWDVMLFHWASTLQYSEDHSNFILKESKKNS
jgi:hypothetical protein